MDISTLKDHLSEELYGQVEAALREVDGLTIIPTNDGTWLPKARLDEEISKQKGLKSTIATLNQQLAEARQKGEAADSLQSTIGVRLVGFVWVNMGHSFFLPLMRRFRF